MDRNGRTIVQSKKNKSKSNFLDKCEFPIGLNLTTKTPYKYNSKNEIIL